MNKQTFRFKQFSVDQSGCAMKINTDGVLLGASVTADNPITILDIGTGTGVIALMLAQRFYTAKIDAVEVDEAAAQTAERNFKASPFADRLTPYALNFESYFEQFPKRKYDLIVSNPPFYINSLKSPKERTTLAKHSDTDFFEQLIKKAAAHLIPVGHCWLILPVNLAEIVANLAASFNLYPRRVFNIQSFAASEIHRVVLCFGFDKALPQISKLTIYKVVGVYSEAYEKLLHPYFLAF